MVTPVFFDAVRVKEDELDQLYDFDLTLNDEVDQIAAAVDQLAAAAMSNEGVGEAIVQLNGATAAANETFIRRKDVLTRTEAV